MVHPLQIGTLGAARITPAALVRPARNCPGAEVAAVAARDRSRAEAFATRHGIPTVYDSYQELIDATDLDAVYIPLPNGLHAEWTLAALAGGKHVLCEKPFTANAAEAERVRSVAQVSGLTVMEAFHWRYHPLAQRMVDVVAGGELGEIRRVEASLVFPIPNRLDIRWQLDLAGGSLMDAGCYPVHMVRTLAAAAGHRPSVLAASARVRSPGVDRWIQAELDLGNGCGGRVTAGMWSTQVFRSSARVVGSNGTMSVFNPLAPQAFNLMTIKGPGGTRRTRMRGRATYDYQLEAFVAAVRDGVAPLTGPDDSVENMQLIDDIYAAAGLPLRRGTSQGPVTPLR
ncbi:MAG: Gfo/Idh/MocA family oxidoreductase [Acidimicrobiaceae bacterium]|nr:Gfo/Idh/MocA family oxidoreductase [Acidimicrobiaceae bacterium]